MSIHPTARIHASAVIGPLIAGALIVIYVTDSTEVLRQAERMLLDAWTSVIAAFRR